MKKTPFKAFRHALTNPAIRLVIFLSVVSPRWLSRINAFAFGWILSILPLASNKVVRDHQRGVMRDNGIYTSVSTVYSSVLSGFFDFFYFSYRSDEKFRKVIDIKGSHHMEQALASGKGIIAVTAHYGPWELLPRAMKLLGYDLAVVGKELSQKGAADVLNKLRGKPGIKTIDRDAGAAPIIRYLRENKTLGMLIDQDTRGVQSESACFIGKPAQTPVAPAVFARKLQVPVVTMHITRQKDHTYLLEIDEPLFFTQSDSVTDILTLLNLRISRWILHAPEQWVWFHKRWRRKPG